MTKETSSKHLLLPPGRQRRAAMQLQPRKVLQSGGADAALSLVKSKASREANCFTGCFSFL